MIERLRKGDEVPFTQISNAVLTDKTISLAAKGLLAFMLSKPDGWQFNVRALASQLKETKNCIARIVKELIAAGYLERIDHRGANGKFAVIEYVVRQSKNLQTAVSRKRDMAKSPCPEKPCPENGTVSNTILSNINNPPFLPAHSSSWAEGEVLKTAGGRA